MTSIERQIERNLARCRVILSVAAIATVYIDPEIPLMSQWITGRAARSRSIRASSRSWARI
jgi:hypothetical protein